MATTGSTLTDSCVVRNVLPDEMFQDLSSLLRSSVYMPLPLDKPQILHLALVPQIYDAALHSIIEERVGSKLKDLKSFARLNTEELDTNFRVHSDGKIYGVYPDVAAVFYLDTRDDAGTALYEHPVYGRRPKDPLLGVHKIDDGQWTPWMEYFQEANSMFIYDAQLFHGRFPWKSYGQSTADGRIVIVKFMKRIPGAFE